MKWINSGTKNTIYLSSDTSRRSDGGYWNLAMYTFGAHEFHIWVFGSGWHRQSLPAEVVDDLDKTKAYIAVITAFESGEAAAAEHARSDI